MEKEFYNFNGSEKNNVLENRYEYFTAENARTSSIQKL